MNDAITEWLNELARQNHPVIERMRRTVAEMLKTGDFGTDVTDLSDEEFIRSLIKNSRPADS